MNLEVTPQALTEIRRVRAEEPQAAGCPLRIIVSGGGLHGMQYKMGFDNQPGAPQDKRVNIEDLEIVVDSRSALFLKGCVIDFLKETFIFRNPNDRKVRDARGQPDAQG